MDIRLRKLRTEDKEQYILLQREYWVDKRALDEKRMQDNLWQELQEEKRINFVIMMLDEKFCGFCGAKDKYADIPEVEIEIFEEFTGRGIGCQAMDILLKELKEQTGKTRYLTRVISDNYPSIKLMQKCGAVPYGVEPHILLNGEETEDFARQHMELISEEVVQLAEIFGVSKEQLLSGVLCFYIDLEDRAQEKFRFKWQNVGRFKRRMDREILLYSMKLHIARIQKITEAADEGRTQALNQMLVEYRDELVDKMKRIGE